MTDDPIRALLAPLARRAFDTPPGFVLVPWADVQAAGGDHDAVLAWVRAHGGGMHRPPDYESKALGLGRRRHIERGHPSYMVPADALAE